MSYRDFTHPAAARSKVGLGYWLDWMHEQGDILVPVAPHHVLSCAHCFGACRYRDDSDTWSLCWKCDRVYGAAVDTFVPITYSLDFGLESMLHQYKDSGAAGQWLRRPLAALLTTFVREHADCIDHDARGIDLATAVPSDDPQRSFNHLQRLIDDTVAGNPVLNRFDWDLEAIARDPAVARPPRGNLSPYAYVVDRRAVAGATVLLLDDTWTSGSSAASAAAALKEGGALHVTVLTLGRQLNSGNHFGSSEALIDDRAGAEWTLGDCVLCA